LLALALMPCVALAQDAKVRASLADKGDCWVGERVTLVVELLAPGYFAGAPSFDLPDPPGVLLVPPVGSPTLGSEEIDGTTYTVQRHELSVFARRAGAQTIPPLTVRFRFERQPLDKETVPASVRTEPLSLTAKAPHGAEGLGGIISARGLTAVESWTPAEPKKAKAGDAFTRTVTYAAPDVPAMAFPPFPIARVDGLGAYPKPPEVLDHSERDHREQPDGDDQVRRIARAQTLAARAKALLAAVHPALRRPFESVLGAAHRRKYRLGTGRLTRGCARIATDARAPRLAPRSVVGGLQHRLARPADHHLAGDRAHPLDAEVSQVLGDPLRGDLGRALGLLGAAEHADRHQRVVAGPDHLVADEAGLLGEGIGEVPVDPVHQVVHRARREPVGPDACVHGCSLRSGDLFDSTPARAGPQAAADPKLPLRASG